MLAPPAGVWGGAPTVNAFLVYFEPGERACCCFSVKQNLKTEAGVFLLDFLSIFFILFWGCF